jgi:inorganic pyrophosphatase
MRKKLSLEEIEDIEACMCNMLSMARGFIPWYKRLHIEFYGFYIKRIAVPYLKWSLKSTTPP